MKLRLAEDTVEDALRFTTLYNSIYGRQVNSEYYKWQFFSPPYPAYLYFAFAKSIFIGCIGVHVKIVLPYERCVLMLIDMMVAHNHRGQGVFRALHEKVLEHGDLFKPIAATVMANNPGMLSLTSRLKWSIIEAIPTFKLSTINSPRTLDSTMSLTLRTNGFLTFERSPAYQNWRYNNHPIYNYETTKFKDSYAVTKLFRDPSNDYICGDIVESRVNSGSEANHILNELIFKLKSEGVTEIHTWLHSKALWNSCCRKQGFVKTNLRRYFCVRLLDNSFSKVCNKDIWSLHLSDSEIF